MINLLIKMRNGFATMEFSILMIVAIVAIISMQPFLKRVVQGRLRGQIDQFAPQFSYEHGAVTTRTIESSSSNAAEAAGIVQENLTQVFSRTTDETIAGSDVETHIGL